MLLTHGSCVSSDVYLVSKEHGKLILMRLLTHHLQRRWHQSANQCLADFQDTTVEKAERRSSEASADFNHTRKF